MKQYQHWLAQYLTCHRDNGHVMAAELAESIGAFWQARLIVRDGAASALCLSGGHVA